MARPRHARYEPIALDGVSFDVEQGHIVGLIGPNGAGKTTTLRAVCGMVKSGGTVRFGGERIDGRATEDIVRCRGARSSA